MKRFLSLVCGLLLALPAGPLGAQTASPTPAVQSGAEAAAQTAGEVWLALNDDARYDASYQATAGIFQKIVSKENWPRMAAAGRGPLGKVVTRKVKDAKFTPTMPGAPDGQYVVIHYETSFEKKTSTVETLTVMLDTDGQWKVCGYFIR